MIKKDDSTMILKSGKKIYVNHGLISIDDDNNIYEGYDGEIDIYDYNELTKDERIEIAEYMIERWKKYLNFIKESK